MAEAAEITTPYHEVKLLNLPQPWLGKMTQSRIEEDLAGSNRWPRPLCVPSSSQPGRTNASPRSTRTWSSA